MKVLYTLLALLALSGLGGTAYAKAPAAEAAREFVVKSQAGANLGQIALSAAMRTNTYGLLTAQVGSQQAEKSVTAAIKGLLPKYQPQWDQHLVEAYSQSFSAKELASLASEGRESKYADKVMSKQPDIGKAMQASARPVLIELVTEALKVAVAAHPVK